MDLSKLTLGDKIAGGTSIVLVITLLFLPWHKVDFFGGSVTRTAIESPNGFWGILALLLSLAIIGVLVASRLAGADLPELPIPWNQAIFYAAIAVLVILFLKLIMETEALGWGSYLAILLGGGLVYGGFLISKESGDLSPGAGPSGPPQAF